jgi:hypothetical protein
MAGIGHDRLVHSGSAWAAGWRRLLGLRYRTSKQRTEWKRRAS